MMSAKTKATASKKKDDVPSSSAPSTVTTPLAKRSLRDILEASGEGAETISKAKSPSRDDQVTATTCHVLDYESSDSEDSIFAFALTFSYTMYSFDYFIYLFAIFFYFMYDIMQ